MSKAQFLSPKREFRAAWIATVSNIDWPSKRGLPSIQQQQEFIQKLELCKRLGCNAVIVQIRPSCDAFYPCDAEPWSCYLTGRQGVPPFPYYDPLKFMIEETHKRQMEFHAWFNPFRALVDSKKNPNPPNHVTRTHPDWIVNYGGKSYINPGIPEAREYVVKIITDVVKKYDIDAVHLDDYFYPYRIGNIDFGDGKSYAQYNANFNNKADWRRNNVNLFIAQLHTNIRHIKSYMKFGISPFGIWRNANTDPEGSDTHGQSNYDDLYADVLLWLQRGWIDYVLPQLYWEHGHHSAPFDVLLPWWEAHSYGRQVYYGLGVYRMVNASSGVWSNMNELLWQIKDIRRFSKTPGFSFYSISSFEKIDDDVTDSIHNKYARNIALMPEMKWLDSIPPVAPVAKAISSSQGTLIQWTLQNANEEPVKYVVYRFVNNEPINLQRSDKIIQLTNASEYLDNTSSRFDKCTYIVTALDRLWNESKPSNKAVVEIE